MRVCADCGGELEAAYRFCPWCGVVQRRKFVEFRDDSCVDDHRLCVRHTSMDEPVADGREIGFLANVLRKPGVNRAHGPVVARRVRGRIP